MNIWLAIMVVFAAIILPASARDNGQYAQANPEIKNWFNKLSSKRGNCCSDADGTALSDVDWETKAGKYRVKFQGEWYDVPDDALITEPNKVGRTMLWAFKYPGGTTHIRCFMPGAMG